MLIQLLIDQPQAALTIVQRTPTWVWALLAGLVLLGLVQMRPRRVRPLQTAVLPLALAVLSLGGLLGVIASTTWALAAAVLWLLVAVGVLLANRRRPLPTGIRYEPTTHRVHLPGSSMPLLVMLALFLLKYAVGVELALQPALREHAGFVMGLAVAYGALSGLLATRSAAIWRFAAQRSPA